NGAATRVSCRGGYPVRIATPNLTRLPTWAEHELVHVVVEARELDVLARRFDPSFNCMFETVDGVGLRKLDGLLGRLPAHARPDAQLRFSAGHGWRSTLNRVYVPTVA